MTDEHSLSNCPYCDSPVRIYQEHPEHPGWYAECSSTQMCIGTGTCDNRERAEKKWKEITINGRVAPFP